MYARTMQALKLANIHTVRNGEKSLTEGGLMGERSAMGRPESTHAPHMHECRGAERSRTRPTRVLVRQTFPRTALG